MEHDSVDGAGTPTFDLSPTFLLATPGTKRAAGPRRMLLTTFLSISAAFVIALLIQRCVYRLRQARGAGSTLSSFRGWGNARRLSEDDAGDCVTQSEGSDVAAGSHATPEVAGGEGIAQAAAAPAPAPVQSPGSKEAPEKAGAKKPRGQRGSTKRKEPKPRRSFLEALKKAFSRMSLTRLRDSLKRKADPSSRSTGAQLTGSTKNDSSGGGDAPVVEGQEAAQGGAEDGSQSPINPEEAPQAAPPKTSSSSAESLVGSIEGATGGGETPGEGREEEPLFTTREEELQFLREAKGRTDVPEGFTREDLMALFKPKLLANCKDVQVSVCDPVLNPSGPNETLEEFKARGFDDITVEIEKWRRTLTQDQIAIAEGERVEEEGKKARRESDAEYVKWYYTEGDDDDFTD
ncbi:hypothetical protein Emed_005706 [Eimeria media]